MPEAEDMADVTRKLAKEQEDQREPEGAAQLPSNAGAAGTAGNSQGDDQSSQPPANQMVQQKTSAPGGKA